MEIKNIKIFDQLISDEFSIFVNCMETKSINLIQKDINNCLIQYITSNNQKAFKDFRITFMKL
jgi:hypothetical protein